jgi:hypothetical protein
MDVDEIIEATINATHNSSSSSSSGLLPHDDPSTAFMIFGLILYTIAFLFSIGSSIFVCCYRKNPIVAMGQPHFLIAIFTGACFMAASGYFWIAANIIHHSDYDDIDNNNLSNAMCIGWAWFLITGHTAIYMSLFGKLWRIKKVLQMRRGQTILVEHTIWPLRVAMLCNIMILISWTIIDPPKYVRIDNIDGTETIGTCDFFQLPFFIPVSIIIVISAALMVWMAYKTRNLPDELSEGRGIWHISVSHSIFFLIFGTLYWFGRFIPLLKAMNAGVLIGVFLTSMTTVGHLIIPRMYYIWYEKKYGHLPEGVLTFGTGQTHITGVQSSSGHL